MPSQGNNFIKNSYVPNLGDIVHLDWAPSIGSEMNGPHYGLVISANAYNIGTGLSILCPITTKNGKLSGFELPIKAGRVKGVAILSALRSVDYQVRNVQFECAADPKDVTEANRRIRMIFP
ncbi:MAG: type II toxin-antitoxin system PemK/MazF family toxin [Rhodospirillaceae bacterium]